MCRGGSTYSRWLSRVILSSRIFVNHSVALLNYNLGKDVYAGCSSGVLGVLRGNAGRCGELGRRSSGCCKGIPGADLW